MRLPLLACCSILALGGMAVVRGGVGNGANWRFIAGRETPSIAGVSGTFSCTVSYVHDGDTFRCTDGTRVRVAGIDAREVDGSCAPGHPCASAPPEEATAALRGLVEGQTLSCEANGTTYNRVAAWCYRGDGADVSCAMLASGTVAKWARYWRGHRCGGSR